MSDVYTYTFRGKVYEWYYVPKGFTIRPALGYKASAKEIMAALKSLQRKRKKGNYNAEK